MEIRLELPSELENELSTEASQLKLPLAEYILCVLAFRPFLQNLPKTGVELVAYWESIGVVGSRSDVTDSQEHARRLRNVANAVAIFQMRKESFYFRKILLYFHPGWGCYQNSSCQNIVFKRLFKSTKK